MNKDLSNISSILNLRSNTSIAPELAERQLLTIEKGYQFLSKSDNNLLYIADDVGLGKTYIAIGIALMFRHFAHVPENHKDVIIVPKHNLQEKWKKDIGNFLERNYSGNEELKTSLKSKGVNIRHKVQPVSNEDSYTIYRMTSFSSIGANGNTKKELRQLLLNDIFSGDSFCNEILLKAWNIGYFINDNRSKLRHLCAYLCNALSPRVQCLIIDEAHNYKYGIGEDDGHEESYRNENTARFLGAIRDSTILNDFPELEQKVKFPLAEKVICLSATPRDRHIIEIKKQLSCFTSRHILSGVTDPAKIETRLSKFMIRGNLKYGINGEKISRNQCRVEHRLGNVNKAEVAQPIVIEDNFDAVLWQLLQYKAIRHLEQKNNASFELGMLASFETYVADADNKPIPNETQKEDKEFEQANHRGKEKSKSQDLNLLRDIISDYQKEFYTLPPHPKQTMLANELLEQLKRQEKALIFVRRINSSNELEERLIRAYENEVVLPSLKLLVEKKSFDLKKIIGDFEDYHQSRDISSHLTSTFETFLSKNEISAHINEELKDIISNQQIKNLELSWLKTAYNNDHEKCKGFKNETKNFIRKKGKNLTSAFKNLIKEALQVSKDEFIEQVTNSSEQEDDSEDGRYFFLDYFKKGHNGNKYRQKMYRENWFDFNLLLLIREFGFMPINEALLSQKLSQLVLPKYKTTHQPFNFYQDSLLDHLKAELVSDASNLSKSIPISSYPSKIQETTFLTRLIIEHCFEEFAALVQRENKLKVLSYLETLSIVLTNIFRNASGLLPGYVADIVAVKEKKNYADVLLDLITNNRSPFHFVLDEIKTIIRDFDLLMNVNFSQKSKNEIDGIFKNCLPILGVNGQQKRDRSLVAAQFRMPGFPYILITTDIFREGEDLHTYCQNVYHYGIAWNPSDMEQRTGRIDRINSASYRKITQKQDVNFDSKIQVFFPYIKGSVEVNQVIQLLHNLNKFIEAFNDITHTHQYESTTKADQKWEESDIPLQITNKLESKYDVYRFEV
jgi:hypothetical protein